MSHPIDVYVTRRYRHANMDAAATPLYGAAELAREFGITPRALRFYESKGLIAPRRAGRQRVYDYRDRARLGLILRGKRLGFSLAEIREYLELYYADASRVGQLRRLAAAVRGRIADLEQQRDALERTLDELGEIYRETCAALRERGVEPGAAAAPAAVPNATAPETDAR